MSTDPQPTFALSTMWYQGRFDNLTDFALAARRLGFENVEISYVVPPEGFDELAATDAVRITSLHAPTPRVKIGGRSSETLNLASLDEEERKTAIRLHIETMEHAARLGAHWVVVHLGGVGSIRFPDELELKRLYADGVREGPEVQRLRDNLCRQRADGAQLYYPKALLTLEELAQAAARLGVAIGLEDRIHYHEFPLVDEAIELLRGYPHDLVGYWHDVGHAEVLDRLGLADKYRWLKELGDRTLGAHLHDVDGIVDHRAPGQGDADWDYVAQYLPAAAPRTFEINQTIPEEQVAASIGILREHGVI